MNPDSSPLLDAMIGQVVVVDLASSYVGLGTLSRLDAQFLELTDADLHDFRDSQATREIYIFDSSRYGIRRNRARVLIRRADVVAVALLSDVVES